MGQVDVLADFSAFIPMFHRFFGPVIHFPEGMFRVSNRFTNHFYRFGHSEVSFIED